MTLGITLLFLGYWL